MRLDAHQHFWAYDPGEYAWISEAMPQIKRDFLPPDLEPLLAEQSIDACIAVQARQHLEETDFLLRLARQYSSIRGVVGWIDLQSENVEQQVAIYANEPLLKGIRHIVQDEPDERFLLRNTFLRGVNVLKESGLTYDILIYEKHLPVAVQFAEKAGEMPLVLDHIGKPQHIANGPSKAWLQGIKALAELPHVYCKLSGLVTEADWSSWRPDDFRPFLDHVFECFGTDRLMFGSDWPVCLLAAPDYARVYDIISAFMSGLPAEDQAKVFGLNAARFYCL